ncbi:MAG: DNA repair protein RecN [Deltaproteobacteria bacterium]|nr:MAG: DNA repair protein RecN [Deltaproteobacteria bacterium]
MLCELRVANLALIESLELVFDQASGLIVMTGETGAGKSIMLRAITLLTGVRSQSGWVREGADSCVVEARFELAPSYKSLLDYMEKCGFDREPELVIKRVVSAAGRSRLYVNGSLATVKVVRELTASLLNVASQHDHQQLLQPGSHLDFVDTMGGIWELRDDFAKSYEKWQDLLASLQELKKAEQDKEQKKDFLSFQLDEIRGASLTAGEDELLAAERKRLKGADTLLKVSQESYHLLSNPIADQLASLRKAVFSLAQLDPELEDLAEEIGNYSYLAEDYAQRLREYRDSLEINPMRLDEVNERIDLIQNLKRKYGESIEQVLAFADQAEADLQQIDNADQQIRELETEVAALEKTLLEKADKLHRQRKAVGSQLEQAMAAEMASLAFEQAGLEVRWQEVDKNLEELRPSGWDRLEFFFSANPGEPARPLSKVASGGELSRLMLAMKCILAKKDLVETVIFDEVDSGIGGEAAEAVARKIQELSGHHQVLCITHLPQIAARGTEHFMVSKQVDDGRTQSSIRKLEQADRVNELARMLAGDSATEQTRAWARELLENGVKQVK